MLNVFPDAPSSLKGPVPRSVIIGAWFSRMPTSPSYAGATTDEASPSKSTLSGEITETFTRSALLGHLGGVGDDVIDSTGHEERLLGKIVELAGNQSLER